MVYKDRLARGRCGRCAARPPRPGLSTCQECADKVAKRYWSDPKAWNAKAKRIRDQHRLDVIKHYGDKCACCGETTPEFLAIDHIDGIGKERRRSGSSFYIWIKAQGYPDHLQVLCHNCNMAKSFYGRCPHTS